MASEDTALLVPSASNLQHTAEQISPRSAWRPRIIGIIFGVFLLAAVTVVIVPRRASLRVTFSSHLAFGPEDGFVTFAEEQEAEVSSINTSSNITGNASGEKPKDKLNQSMDCTRFPYLRLLNVTHSNLGGKGPDSGEPGLIYSVRVEGGSKDGEEFQLHVNVTSPAEDFHPQSAKEIGFQGKYGSINLKAGSNVTLEIEKFDTKTGEHVPFGGFYFTFYDLDQGPSGEASESVTLSHFTEAYIANRSEVNVTKLEDGGVVLSATKEGTGADNPKDPLHLTKQQFRKAVTVDVRGIEKFVVTLAVGPSKKGNPRWFNFRGQPSMLCAAREDGTHLPMQHYSGASSGRQCGSVVLIMALLTGSSLRRPFA